MFYEGSKKTGAVVAGSILIVLLIGNLQAYATTYYCDPVGGDTETGDGSAGNPWGTLESVRKAGYFGGSPISAGDTVKLETGFHGMFDTGVNNATDYVTIEPNDDAADPNAEFTSWPTGDISLLVGSNYIDAASLGLYPTLDINGIWRETPDVGPYEYGTETGGKYILIGE